MCSGPAGESRGHLLPLRRRETGEAESAGLCGHSKGPRSSFNSRAGEPHSSAAPQPAGALENAQGENGENEEASTAARKPSRRSGSCSVVREGKPQMQSSEGITAFEE